MARIRTIKPEFFRNIKLQDLETKNPGQNLMLTFAGLWCIADANGVFVYSPPHIKLDVLPFLDFDVKKTLQILEKNSFIKSFEVESKIYAQVCGFNEHQKINGKEAEGGGRYPLPPWQKTNINQLFKERREKYKTKKCNTRTLPGH